MLIFRGRRLKCTLQATRLGLHCTALLQVHNSSAIFWNMRNYNTWPCVGSSLKLSFKQRWTKNKFLDDPWQWQWHSNKIRNGLLKDHVIYGRFSHHHRESSLIAHPHLLVQVTNERFLSVLVTSSGSHWLNQL